MGRPGRSRGRSGLRVGSLVTGIVVGQAKRGVTVEVGGRELVLERGRFGAASWIDDASYGTALTVEVLESRSGSDTSIGRVGIERSLRQPRQIDGVLRRTGAGWTIVPVDGAEPFEAMVIDRLDVDGLAGRAGAWSVGAAHRGVRLVLPPEAIA